MPDQLANLFAPLTIRGHRFKNRIFSTGHMTVLLDDGNPSDRMVAYHAARAHPSGVSSRPAILAYRDDCIDGGPPPLNWSTSYDTETADQRWQSSVTRRKKSSPSYAR